MIKQKTTPEKKEMTEPIAIRDLIPTEISQVMKPSPPIMKPVNKAFRQLLDFKTLDDGVLKNMLNGVHSFMDELIDNEKPRWISFLGGSGTGKTYLAKKIYSHFKANHEYYQGPAGRHCKTIITKCHDIGFWNAEFLASRFRHGEYWAIESIKNEHLTVIDDLGGEFDSEFMTSKWFEILNSRMGKWTIITCNKSIEEISDQMDNRIASRLVRDGNQFINCNTTDYGFRTVNS